MDKTEIEKLIDEKLSGFQTAVDETVNKALGNRVGKLKDQLSTELKEALTQTLPDALKNLKPETPPKGGKGDQGDDEETKILRSRLEKLENQNKELESERAENRKVDAFSKALKAAGLTRDNATSLLYPVFKERIKATESGALYVGDQTLEEAMTDFAKTEDGKLFRPAKNGSGSGATPSDGPSPKAGKMGLGDAVQGLVREMLTTA